MRRGADVALCAECANGTCGASNSDGSHALFASGLVTDASAVRPTSQGRVLALSTTELRRRNADGRFETLASGLSSARDVAQESNGDFLVLESNALKRISAGVATFLVPSSAGYTFSEINVAADGEILVLGQIGYRRGVFRFEGGTLVPVELGPATVRGVFHSGAEA